ncbi:TetR/AcrR family transcriptional regulator [Pseudalkalibacillus berkeleyi]|uniref:TetR/AcrR family transcriptional regulator n=1 Tax=Pseudalkalibacillus berkeleyi TaxID=1069813 RepID=A0ABS9H0K8_9BACL|nr:TetR/AcrR family transcriptional regulator [Pseudalkalibacillus berkeleyi]MCF6138474.1 TetR/AcrR family transcriptional regulator [Pseudalkalibacillus berkeleyi]
MTNHINTLSQRQLKSVQTRNKLLGAARKVFIDQGFQKTTITQIIKDAELGYGTAYVHFKNKDDILIALIEDVMNQFYKIADLPFRPTTKDEAERTIRKQVGSFLELAKQEQRILAVVEEAIGQSPIVQAKWNDIRERFVEGIAKDITYSQENNLAYPDVDPLLAGKGWFYSNEMFLWEITKRDGKMNLEDIVHNLTTMYVRGLYK